jgi:hypothetical protein
MQTLTYGDAKIQVARVNGDQGNPDALIHAGDSIKAAIREYNVEHEWDFKFTTINYTLPADTPTIVIEDFNKPYTIRNLDGQQNTLKFIRKRLLDRTTKEQNDHGKLEWYWIQESKGVKTIHFFPDSDSSVQLEINYFAEIADPSDDEDDLDVPESVLTGLLSLAKYYYLADKDESTQEVERHRRDADRALLKARNRDKRQPDEDPALIARVEHGQAFAVTSIDEAFPFGI